MINDDDDKEVGKEDEEIKHQGKEARDGTRPA